MGRYLIATLATRTDATVRVYEHAAGLNVADRVTQYEIEGSTGYRAFLSACLRDECGVFLNDRAPLTVCLRKIDDRRMHSGMSVAKWCDHIQTHCHGWHEESARVFARRVADTYGSPVT